MDESCVKEMIQLQVSLLFNFYFHFHEISTKYYLSSTLLSFTEVTKELIHIYYKLDTHTGYQPLI